ncbi:MAG: hypothetical protein R3240_06500 [Gammaproteobacteria bacterium]|nr:hypothetical protein [Gammaproteobacteria bacterium]
MSIYSTEKLVSEARRLASEYRKATGKALGISGEIAEFDAAHLLNLELCDDRSAGYDAVGKGSREGKRIQIKGRAIFDEQKSGQRIGQLKTEQDWDSVVLVLMNEDYEATELYEADRDILLEALNESSSNNRKKRGAMSVAKFKIISNLVWSKENGLIEETENSES